MVRGSGNILGLALLLIVQSRGGKCQTARTKFLEHGPASKRTMSKDFLDPKSETPSPPKRWQFRLWHLFALTTYAAVVLGIATWQGPPTLMVTLGLGLALLSHLKAFEPLQRGRAQFALIGVAWVTYLVSFCTPCTTGTFTVFGWQAAWMYLGAPVAALFEKDSSFDTLAWPWVVSVDLSNLLQAVLPLHLWRLRLGRGRVLATLSCLAMVAPWVTLIVATDLFVAYYLWCISFMLLVIAVPVSRGTLIGMTGLAALHFAIFKLFGP
jgi:hypothetical protein